MENQTTNYGFRQPIITANDTTWGNDFASGDPAVDPSPGLNGNWSKMDLILKMQRDKIAELRAALDDLPDFLDGLRIQIGGLYPTTDGTDPATTLGYGVWEPWGLGRALVSTGDNGEHDWQLEEERGAEVHTLTTGELPAHAHTVDPPNTATSANGGHSHSYTGAGGLVRGNPEGSSITANIDGTKTTNFVANHVHFFTFPAINSGNVGGGGSHNNVMPSKACYIWKRTA